MEKAIIKLMDKWVTKFAKMKNIKLLPRQKEYIINNILDNNQIWDTIAIQINNELNKVRNEVI